MNVRFATGAEIAIGSRKHDRHRGEPMESISLDKAWQRPAAVPDALQHAASVFVERLLRHPFLVRCGDGTVTVGELREFLVQQGKYSSYFTRYLCALISHLEHGDDVLRLAGNLAEELGYGRSGQTPHSRIYADMLRGFGLALESHPTYPETQNLIDTMFMLCRQPGGTAGLGALCLGAEAVVPAVYARIIEGFRWCGVDMDRLQFFSLHVECDDDHARTMREIITRRVSSSRSSRISALSAGEIAINARLRFFDALVKETH
jgi:pyrroloquinoline-quinone synthase